MTPDLLFTHESMAHHRLAIGDTVETSLRRYTITRTGFSDNQRTAHGRLTAVWLGEWRTVRDDPTRPDEQLFTSGDWRIVQRQVA